MVTIPRRPDVYLIQILLPRYPNAVEGTNDAAFARTRSELVEKFDGVTAYLRGTAQGVWTAPDGRVERDEMVMVEVLAESFDREWWRGYADTLAQRFEQQEMHIRALPAQTP
jgi:hypothetical protein